MSKFLKFIVHLIVICTILCVLALALPPFFGVETVVMDNSEEATNLPAGSVTYAIPVKVEDVTVGTPILVQEDSKTYRYNLVNVNPETHTGTVIDPSTSSDEGITVSVYNWVAKVVVTVGLLGYLQMATQSLEGMIILGLAILFLIILYVIAELWRKEPEDEYEDYQGDIQHVKTEKELKAEERDREKRMNQEDKELLQDAKARRKKEKKAAKDNRRKIHTGGFVDEIYEDDLDDEETAAEAPAQNVNMQAATTEAHELLKKEIAAATADETVGTDTTDLRAALGELSDLTDTKDLQGTEISKDPKEESAEADEPQEEQPMPVLKMAIPRYTAAQLASKARKAGDAPDIVKDAVTKVTLLDYSDIIGSDAQPEEEE